MQESEIYQAIGSEGFARLVRAFYAQIPGDDILGPMYPAGDLPGAEERLRDFLIFRFGGSGRYVEQRGHPRLGMRHARFPIDAAVSRRWLDLMDNAFRAAALPREAEDALRPFFAHVANFLVNRRPQEK